MKIFLFLLLFFSSLVAKDLSLDKLLKKYEDSESLYKKTKKESAGFLLVYSRDDLERMQAFTLEDVMKTVRMYTLQINRMGTNSPIKATSSLNNIPPIKLYIDDHEVNTVLQANALYVYGKMNLYFVDHIEIYQGGSSIAFRNEPGSMVVKLYSKDPSRENSSSVQVSVDSKASGDLSAVSAGKYKDYEYLFYADAGKTNFDTFLKNNQNLSRDNKRYQAHFKISENKNFDLVVDVINAQSDIYNGFGNTPLGDDVSRTYAYIDYTKYFKGDWKVSLSASSEEQKVNNKDLQGIKLVNSQISKYFNVRVTSNTYKAIIEKKIVSGKSDLLIGSQFQKKVFNTKHYDVQNYIPNFDSGNTNIYMFYLEELYNLNENNLIAFSGKLDYYNPDFAENTTEYSLRLAYTSLLNKDWHAKIFGIRRYVYPVVLQSAWAPPVYHPNSALKSSTINMLAGELEYNNDINRILFGYAYKIIDDGIGYSKLKKSYINNKDRVDFQRFYVRGEHYFDLDNKLILEYFKAYNDKSNSPSSGVLVQLFNKIGQVDIYNELVYREKFSINNVHVDAGYNYTLGLTYAINKKSNVKLKGENLFDKANKTVIDFSQALQAPAIEQRVIATYEYTF